MGTNPWMSGWLGMLMVAALTNAADRPPNFIFFLADDLGYGELGCYGQALIRTPRIDRLAAGGLRFTDHHAGNAVCAPSRCVLMTGQHPGHAFIRTNRSVGAEGQYPIPDSSRTIANLLREWGYATGGFGKWGLGPVGSSGDPNRQGFDRFFGYNCQAVAHNHYPAWLWNNERRVRLDNPPFSAHQRLPVGLDPRDPINYARYTGSEYAPDRIAEEALQFIRDHHDRPFFLYVPTTIPHLALQVPTDSLEEYDPSMDEEPYDGRRRYLPHPRPRAAYAAMVTRMDREVGRIVDLVEELGLAADTLIVFTSDNGPAAEGVGGSDSDYFRSAGPLRGRKGSLYEGGTRVPCVAYWPGKIAASKTTDRLSGFEDWLPTFLDLAGAADTIPEDVDGISLRPTLEGKAQPARPFLYREFTDGEGQQSIRIGTWKGLRRGLMRPREGDIPIELYDLSNDIGETQDASAKNPEVIARMVELFASQHTPSPVFPLPALDDE